MKSDTYCTRKVRNAYCTLSEKLNSVNTPTKIVKDRDKVELGAQYQSSRQFLIGERAIANHLIILKWKTNG